MARRSEDLVFNPATTQTLSVKTLHMKVDYNPYEGREIHGVSETVIAFVVVAEKSRASRDALASCAQTVFAPRPE